ncbi:unnamed protein product, partial [Rotaria socialis]
MECIRFYYCNCIYSWYVVAVCFSNSIYWGKKKFFQGQALGEIMAQFVVNPTLLRVVRVARVGRVLRLVK